MQVNRACKMITEAGTGQGWSFFTSQRTLKIAKKLHIYLILTQPEGYLHQYFLMTASGHREKKFRIVQINWKKLQIRDKLILIGSQTFSCRQEEIKQAYTTKIGF